MAVKYLDVDPFNHVKWQFRVNDLALVGEYPAAAMVAPLDLHEGRKSVVRGVIDTFSNYTNISNPRVIDA